MYSLLQSPWKKHVTTSSEEGDVQLTGVIVLKSMAVLAAVNHAGRRN